MIKRLKLFTQKVLLHNVWRDKIISITGLLSTGLLLGLSYATLTDLGAIWFPILAGLTSLKLFFSIAPTYNILKELYLFIVTSNTIRKVPRHNRQPRNLEGLYVRPKRIPGQTQTSTDEKGNKSIKANITINADPVTDAEQNSANIHTDQQCGSSTQSVDHDSEFKNTSSDAEAHLLDQEPIESGMNQGSESSTVSKYATIKDAIIAALDQLSPSNTGHKSETINIMQNVMSLFVVKQQSTHHHHIDYTTIHNAIDEICERSDKHYRWPVVNQNQCSPAKSVLQHIFPELTQLTKKETIRLVQINSAFKSHPVQSEDYAKCLHTHRVNLFAFLLHHSDQSDQAISGISQLLRFICASNQGYYFNFEVNFDRKINDATTTVFHYNQPQSLLETPPLSSSKSWETKINGANMKSEVQLDKIANTARTTMIYRLVHVIIIDSYSNTKDEQLLQNTAKELETITAFSKEIRDVAQHLSFSQLSNSSPTIR